MDRLREDQLQPEAETDAREMHGLLRGLYYACRECLDSSTPESPVDITPIYLAVSALEKFALRTSAMDAIRGRLRVAKASLQESENAVENLEKAIQVFPVG